MIPGIDIETFIKTASLVGVALVIFAESGLLVGFFLPGDSLLFLTGFLVKLGILKINILIVIAVIWLAAVLGDSTGYTIGQHFGRKLFQKENSKIFKKERIQQAEAFYDKNGGKTILLARFIPIIRTFVPVVAGISKMKYQDFIVFNIIGGLLWSTVITGTGYLLGSWFKSMHMSIDQIILPAMLIIVFISLLPPIIGILRSPEGRQKVKDLFKKRK